jgi:hypothetical protein
MNLRLANGQIPIKVGGDQPYIFVPFPSKTVFMDLYARRISKDNIFKYWEILQARSQGATLEDAGRPFGLTKERVRQIEAKFMRLFRDYHLKSSAKIGSPQDPLPEDGNR